MSQPRFEDIFSPAGGFKRPFHLLESNSAGDNKEILPGLGTGWDGRIRTDTHPSHASLKDGCCSKEQLRVSCELLPSVL